MAKIKEQYGDIFSVANGGVIKYYVIKVTLTSSSFKDGVKWAARSYSKPARADLYEVNLGPPAALGVHIESLAIQRSFHASVNPHNGNITHTMPSGSFIPVTIDTPVTLNGKNFTFSLTSDLVVLTTGAPAVNATIDGTANVSGSGTTPLIQHATEHERIK